MKKIIFSLLAIVGLVSSCTNDEIEVESYNDLTYNVSTQSVYEKFGIAEDFKKKFLSESWSIGVFTYIYDEEGLLVASDSIHTKTFGKIEQDFTKLNVGKYTAITIEMLVDDEDNFQSDCWIILGQEKQSTLEIANKSYEAYWYNAVGVTSTQLVIEKGKSITYDITPEPIGSIVYCKFQDFDKSDYKMLAFLTKDQPFGRFVSPNINGADRFDFKKYNDERTFDVRGKVFKMEIEQEHYPAVYLLEEGDINYCFGAFKLDANNELINGFYARPSDRVYYEVKDGKSYYGAFIYVGGVESSDSDGMLFDTLNEREEWLLSHKSMGSKFVAYPDVTVEWGSDAQTVINTMNKKSITVSDEIMAGNYYSLIFLNSDITTVYNCYFETTKTNLFRLINATTDPADEVLSVLKMNYVYLGYDSDLQGELLTDGSTAVLFTIGDGMQEILYLPISTTSAPQLECESGKIPALEYVKFSPSISKECDCIQPTETAKLGVSKMFKHLKDKKTFTEQIKSLKEHADVKMK